MEEILRLWSNYIAARQQLMNHQLIRTFNNPVEDFSEILVARIMNGTLALNVNQRDFDVETIDKFIQVKSIAKAPNNTNGYIVTTKDRENQLATHYAFVFFDNYFPVDIFIVCAEFVRDYGKSQIKRQDLNAVCDPRQPNTEGISLRTQNNVLF